VNSGYGNPPIQDPNSLAPHGIYNTNFEIYEFMFDGLVQTIYDTQPGATGSGDGYAEQLEITINSLIEGVNGLHFDLFSVAGGRWDLGDMASDQWLINGFAPFSHDAAFVAVSEPGSFSLLSLGLIGFWAHRKRLKK